MRRSCKAVIVTCLLSSWLSAQVLKTRPTGTPALEPPTVPARITNDSIPLTVPSGTPLKVALDKEVRIRNTGQPVHGKLVEPVYAFDKLLIPVGTEVLGKIAEIEGVSKKRRTTAAMNADFSPDRQVHIEFNTLRLAGGREISIQTAVSPASAGVLQMVPAAKPHGNVAGNMASRKIQEAKQQAHQQWDSAMRQLHEPGKMQRLKRLAQSELPYRPQYLQAGTSFNADLQQPLDFGSEPLQPQSLAAIGTPPPSGSVVHAFLDTPLSSATSKRGDSVDAVITQPLMAANQLCLPEGSHLRGTVLQVRPARRLGRNGQLRIVFHEVVPPSGIEEKVQASLEGVAVAGKEHLSLDSEGGAQVTTPKTRYLTTAISVMLAASSVAPDSDRGLHAADRQDIGGNAANGASGFGLIGTIVGALARSRVVASGFGFYGAGMSVYSHFLARGHDVVYPKDMSMVVALGNRNNHGSNFVQPSQPAPATGSPLGLD